MLASLLTAASRIAVARMAKEENIMPTSPRIICKVAASVLLARMVLKRIEREG